MYENSVCKIFINLCNGQIYCLLNSYVLEQEQNRSFTGSRQLDSVSDVKHTNVIFITFLAQ